MTFTIINRVNEILLIIYAGKNHNINLFYENIVILIILIK